MKRRKIFTLLLALLMFLAGCAQGLNADKPQIPTKAELATKYGVDEAVIDGYHSVYPKIENNATVDNDFATDSVIIIVYPFANSYPFTPEDFQEVGCTAVNKLMGPYENKEKPTRFLLLTLDTESKQEIIDAIEILQERADIYCAEPDYVMTIS